MGVVSQPCYEVALFFFRSFACSNRQARPTFKTAVLYSATSGRHQQKAETSSSTIYTPLYGIIFTLVSAMYKSYLRDCVPSIDRAGTCFYIVGCAV